MKTKFKIIKRLALGLAVLCALCISAVKSEAQIGTYVTPRVTTVFNGWVTNGWTYTNAFIFTNWLNYSGWHNVNFILSESGTNNIGTNQVNLTLTGSPGSGNTYTNAAQGTNYWFTPNALLTWNNNLTATTVYTGTWTNLQQTLADNWLWLRGTFSVVNTNAGVPFGGFYLQIDAVVTP